MQIIKLRFSFGAKNELLNIYHTYLTCFRSGGSRGLGEYVKMERCDQPAKTLNVHWSRKGAAA